MKWIETVKTMEDTDMFRLATRIKEKLRENSFQLRGNGELIIGNNKMMMIRKIGKVYKVDFAITKRTN